jgi:hypothetical protein
VEVVEVLFSAAVPEYTVRMIGSDEIGLNRASVMSDDVESVDPGQVECSEELLASGFVSVVARRLLGLSVAFEIDCDASVSVRKFGHLVMPLVPGFWNAVQEYDRFAVAGLHVVEAHCLVIAGSVDEVMGERDTIEHLGIAFCIGRTGCHIAELGHPSRDELLVGHEIGENRNCPFGKRCVIQVRCRHLAKPPMVTLGERVDTVVT